MYRSITDVLRSLFLRVRNQHWSTGKNSNNFLNGRELMRKRETITFYISEPLPRFLRQPRNQFMVEVGGREMQALQQESRIMRVVSLGAYGALGYARPITELPR